MDIEVKTKRWGNSIGIIVPWETVKALKLKDGENVMLQIKRKENPLREMFGALKFDKGTEQMLAEVDAELEGIK